MKKVFDRRRLCTEADLFQTRKSGKTELGASMDFAQFSCMGPANEQCSIVANDANQAIKIAFKAVKAFAMGVDPSAKNKLGGKLLKVGAKEMRFVDGCPRTASLEAFAAGGKPKDGWNSGWVHNDEPGQGKYVNDHNDMESTVQELVGSAGVRRERMRLNTTTAGKVVTGPYKDHIERLETQLLDEMQIPLGTAQPLPYDYNNALLLRLDPWDWTGNVEDLNHRHLFRRVNRAIGITVQPTWYKERIQKALSGTEDERKEVLTKDFNIWQTERVRQWVQPEDIRRVQADFDIMNPHTLMRGMVAFDFSVCDDLSAQVFMAYDADARMFWFDMRAYIPEILLSTHPNKALYKQLVEGGWLKVCPGKVIDENLITADTMEAADHVIIEKIGYDSYKSDIAINNLQTVISSKGGDPNQFLMPVSQTWASFNSAVETFDYLIHQADPQIRFSRNPLWPWCFSNCRIVEDPMGNKKPIKATQTQKIDPAICTLMCIKMWTSVKL